MMRKSFRENKDEWENLILIGAEGKMVILCCYCPPANFCHRHLLARYLQAAAIAIGEPATIIPE